MWTGQMKLWEVNKLQLLKIWTSHFVSNPEVGGKEQSGLVLILSLASSKGINDAMTSKNDEGLAEKKEEVGNHRQKTFTY